MLRILTVSVACVLAALPVVAGASQESFDKQMQPILAEYLTIQETLASDKTDGVAGAAGKIAELAGKLDASDIVAGHAKHYQGIAEKLPAAAKKLQQAGDIKAARAAFAELSKPMVMWAEHQSNNPATVVFCSMYPGSWLQKGTDVRNPYYGSKMLTCGEIVGGGEQDMKHMHH
ncbi:MAG: DUF3347 domain-containing protein [Deltaproteobacteria bacterium]|nr:DUF3347 domain-containing protein [Deltaproteobacteria bacterium]